MSTIQSPNNYHGILGRRIAENLQSESEGEFACDPDDEIARLKQETNQLYTEALQLINQLRNKIQALKLSTVKCEKCRKSP